MKKLVTCLGAGLLLCACGTKSASDYDTSDIVASMFVNDSGGSEVNVSASFRPPGFTLQFIELTNDDDLTLNHNNVATAFNESNLLGLVGYNVRVVEAAGEPFYISLIREEDDGAPETRIEMPDRFELEALPNNASFSRADDDIILNWSIAGETGNFDITLSGECIDNVEVSANSNDVDAVIAAGRIAKRAQTEKEIEDGEEVDDTCAVSVTMVRRRGGDLDPAFGAGDAEGRRTRTTSFDTRP